MQANIERVTGLLDVKPQIVDRPEVEERYGNVFHPNKENWEPSVGRSSFATFLFTIRMGRRKSSIILT